MTTKKTTDIATAEEAKKTASIEEHELYPCFKKIEDFNFAERGVLVSAVLNLEKYIGALQKAEAADLTQAINEGLSIKDLVESMQTTAFTVLDACCIDREGFEAWAKDHHYMEITSFVVDYANMAGKL